jgi:hypothetical protein
MAPEVLRGGKSSFASDIWALGVVMHEIVFGVKPRWSDAASTEMLAPALGRKLSVAERAALEACRVCTAKEPGRRLASAGEAGRLLTERRRWWSRPWRAPRRPIVFAVALTLTAAIAAGVVRTQRRLPDAPTSSFTESQLIIPAGEPADWSHISKVIAEVPDRIQCTRLLPDQRTLRFVWGTPKRAEDIDTVTHTRVPAPLVPVAYAEGCPDLSPDGNRLIYQGHDKDGRAFAFLSQHANGRDAAPVVPTAEPSMDSEPTWFADGESFSYDIDARHMGAYTPALGHTIVLPGSTSEGFGSTFRFATADLIVVSAYFDNGAGEVIASSWPSLKEEMRFRTPGLELDFAAKGRVLLSTYLGPLGQRELIALDRTSMTARRLGWINGQYLRHPRVSPEGLTFVSRRDSSDLEANTHGLWFRVTSTGDVWSANHCGSDFVLGRELSGRVLIERVDRGGRKLSMAVPDRSGVSPGCSPDGRTLFFVDPSSRPKRCDESGCRFLTDRKAFSLAVSPDGERVAITTFDKRGIVASWISAEGGPPHDVSPLEAPCAVGWSSTETLWISRKRAGKVVWTEVNTSGVATGRTVPGTSDCSNGWPDPASPVNHDLRLVLSQTSQLRLLAEKHFRLP